MAFLLGQKEVTLGLSDGGAHLGSFTGADYTTTLSADWTPDPVPVERALWQLSGMAATGHGLRVPRMHARSLAEAPFASVLFPWNHTLAATYPEFVEDVELLREK